MLRRFGAFGAVFQDATTLICATGGLRLLLRAVLAIMSEPV
jgi:hypothetical protein